VNNSIIETFHLSKSYHLKGKKRIHALNDVNISISEGEKFGLLGPNGAGKTTMISILSTLIQPSKGYAIIDGVNILKKPNRIKGKIALMLGSDMIYYRITGYSNLKFFCKIKVKITRRRFYTWQRNLR
jgi:ABC-type multidrug transport system ATPase subunit